jgi:hypothetical protein
MTVLTSISFFSPIALVAIPVIMVGVVVFGADAICNAVGLDPILLGDIPVVKEFPRFDPNNPDQIQ